MTQRRSREAIVPVLADKPAVNHDCGCESVTRLEERAMCRQRAHFSLKVPECCVNSKADHRPLAVVQLSPRRSKVGELIEEQRCPE